jgi:putative acetyltransferase
MDQTLTLEELRSPDPAVEALLARHHADMRAQSPEESCHVMTSDALRASGARVFALRAGGAPCAVGALKPLDRAGWPGGVDWPDSGTVMELKSMHVARARRGEGLGRVLLDGLTDQARASGAVGLCLETGSEPEFAAARALYHRAGFTDCPPFGDYVTDPLSVFMLRRL